MIAAPAADSGVAAVRRLTSLQRPRQTSVLVRIEHGLIKIGDQATGKASKSRIRVSTGRAQEPIRISTPDAKSLCRSGSGMKPHNSFVMPLARIKSHMDALVRSVFAR